MLSLGKLADITESLDSRFLRQNLDRLAMRCTRKSSSRNWGEGNQEKEFRNKQLRERPVDPG